MSGWYDRITADPDDLTPLVDCFAYYEKQLLEAREELDVVGRIEVMAKKLPGLAEYRFNQLQELEAILKYLNIRLDKVRGQRFRFYMEKYDRELKSSDAEKFAAGDDAVIDLALMINHVALLRNKFLGVSKGIEYLHFQIGNVVKLRVAGIEDASL
jgi:hypothetical protein